MNLPEINIDGKQISSIFITKTPDMIGNQPLKININSLIIDNIYGDICEGGV
jgi:hypothetical protein